MIYEFNGYKPVIDETAFIHEQSTVTGNVIIGKNVYIGPGAAIRGDWGKIIIKDGCNVQENCTIHMFPGITVTLHEAAHIGHGAIIHGATIGKNVLIGMNAVIMDNAEISDNCIIGALCFVPADMKIPERKVAVGNPAKIIKDVSDEMIAWKSKGTHLYQQLPKDCYAHLKQCEPLREIPINLPLQQNIYNPWSKSNVSSKIYHIAIKNNWEKAQETGLYYTDSIKAEGFIHCSGPEDFVETANLHYKNQIGLVALCIDSSKVKSELKMEFAPKRGKLFPHIYGPLNIDAVEFALDLMPDKNGWFTFPESFK